MSSISPGTILQRSETILHSDLRDKVVMMDIDEGSYYGLNEVGARVWVLLETPTSVGAICDRLCKEYAVERAECEREVIAFAGELLRRNVISTADGKPA